MSPQKNNILCTVCGNSYASTQGRYHERTCTRTTAEVKYPDPFSDKPGAVTTEVLIRDPLDRKFHCIYCTEFDHKDTEAVKNHGKLCKNAKGTDRVCLYRGQSKAAPEFQSTPDGNLGLPTPDETPSDGLRSSPSLVFDLVFPPSPDPAATLTPLGTPPPIPANTSGAASVLQDHVKPTAVKRPADEPASSHAPKRHAHLVNKEINHAPSSTDLPPADERSQSSPSNPPSNHASSSQRTLAGSGSSQQSSLSSSQSQSINSRTQTIYQALHLLT